MNGVMEKLDADAVVLTAGAASAVIKRHSKTVSQHKKYLIKNLKFKQCSICFSLLSQLNRIVQLGQLH